jgi:hypothetical protein
MNDSVIGWFADKGITAQTVSDFGVHVDDEGAVCFPYGDYGTKRRFGIPTGTRSFRWQKGVDPQLFNLRDANKPNLFLVEGETDTMRLRQEVGDNAEVGVIGLPGIETWRSDMASSLRNANRVWVILDNDQDYQVAGRVDQAWRAIRSDLSQARRVMLPKTINDVCEFFEDYDMDALRTIVQRQPQPGESRFKTLDLTLEPPPVHWVVDSLICKGDIHLLIGEPGIGKSWLTMGMALAVAGDSKEFLGFNVGEQGRVLYLDEENPEDLVYSRFAKLGMSEQAAKNIRYLNNVGVRLDKQADDVIEEALDFEPTLVVLDSLTRFHTEDENHAGAMASLFHHAIKPLARETGAAVVLIHHANKSDSNSSYKRSRGSGDIPASVDAGFDVREVGENSLAVANFKSRRQAQGNTFYVSIVDNDTGGVDLAGGSAQHVPF